MTTNITSPIPKAKSGISLIKAHMVAPGAHAGPKITIALDSNENAFGPSPKALEAAARPPTILNVTSKIQQAFLCLPFRPVINSN